MQNVSSIEDFIASRDGASKIVATPSGMRVSLRPASYFEVGDIFERFPLAKRYVLGGGDAVAMTNDEFLTEVFRTFRGALCALVATCADRPGDEAIEDGLSHKTDQEFWPLVKEAFGLTFPFGLEGYGKQFKAHLTSIGLAIPSAGSSAPADASEASPQSAPKPSISAKPKRR